MKCCNSHIILCVGFKLLSLPSGLQATWHYWYTSIMRSPWWPAKWRCKLHKAGVSRPEQAKLYVKLLTSVWQIKMKHIKTDLHSRIKGKASLIWGKFFYYWCGGEKRKGYCGVSCHWSNESHISLPASLQRYSFSLGFAEVFLYFIMDFTLPRSHPVGLTSFWKADYL